MLHGYARCLAPLEKRCLVHSGISIVVGGFQNYEGLPRAYRLYENVTSVGKILIVANNSVGGAT